MKFIYVMSAFIACSLVLAGTTRAVDLTGKPDSTGIPIVAPFEEVPLDEMDGIKDILGVQELIQKQLMAKKPDARGQHPKAHGCLKGTFQVRENIPPALRVGVFKDARSYDVVMRYSNGREFDDTKQEASHGMAIKLLGVEGKKILPGAHDAQTQDFLLIDSPTFISKNPVSLGKFMVALMGAVRTAAAIGKNTEEARQEFLMANVDEFDEIPRIVQRIKNNKISNPLSTTYHSATPYLLASEKEKFMVRYKIVPTSAPDNSNPVDKPNGLTDAMKKQLVDDKRPAGFEFRIVRYQGALEGAAEDPTQVWKSSEEIVVADLDIPPQDFRSESCEQLSFMPWHTLPEHQPIGGINRARFRVYLESAERRGIDSMAEQTAL